MVREWDNGMFLLNLPFQLAGPGAVWSQFRLFIFMWDIRGCQESLLQVDLQDRVHF